MYPSALAARVVALVVAAVGFVVAFFGLVASSPELASGLDALLRGVVTPFSLLGLLSTLVTLVALAVVFGRGRSAAVSLGGALAVGGVVVLAYPVLTPLFGLSFVVVGFALLFAGASLGVRRRSAA
ncbi:hypothetical protein [Halogeometricum limi]|uniref:Major facilitator superfamily (MFS) profile domain-containing protein n=1 Tax=Halogeometricum limi TaxID=555875 RepID=A0A1I6FQI3_9EURY|nr:hypothetical protein [Halogeometricum limi]SFR32205.1 hypothetical protein SAMN04488124_0079 [Halogeometricum limi]